MQTGKRNRPTKEKRKEKGTTRKEETNTMIWSWTTDDTEFLDFGKVIEKTRTPICWQKGLIDITDWENLKENFRIEASINQKFGGLKLIRREMKRRDCGSFKILTCEKKDKIKEALIRKKMKEDLSELTEMELIKFWRCRKLFKMSERAKMTRKLNEEIKKRKGCEIPINLTLRVQPTREIGKKTIEREIHRWIETLAINRQWKKLLHEEVKIVETRNKTVGSVLLNYREWAKKDWFKIHTCTCDAKKNGRSDTEHEIWKLEEKEKDVGELTTKTVLEPNGIRERSVRNKEMRRLEWLVEKLTGTKTLSKIRIRTEKKGKERESANWEEKLREIKERWRNWVILERDKNNGAMALACPLWYRQKMIETFDWTKWRANYQRVKILEKQILKRWEKENQKRKRKFTWKKDCGIPYCYGLPKEKDVKKLRPIVSYSKHPMKRQLHYIGRVILFLLKQCKVESLTLWKIDDIDKEIDRINKIIKDWIANEDLVLNMEVFDVKEMYTNLPHKEVMEAINWVTELFEEKCRDCVTVIGNRPKDIYVGKKKGGRKINMEEIRETVKMDLENAVFKCGEIIVIQTIGIPMGSPMSPALAIVTCAKAEQQMWNTLNGSIRFQAMRYMDDIWVCTLNRKNERKEDTKKLLGFYDKHLKIEKEREGKIVWFLDREIIWNGETLRTISFNKNLESMKEYGIRKFKNILPMESFGGRKTKKAIIVGRLFRIQIGTTMAIERFWQGWITLLELKMLGYSWNILKDCCSWVGARYKEDVWSSLYQLFLLVGNNYMSHPSFQLEGLKIGADLEGTKKVDWCESGRKKH